MTQEKEIMVEVKLAQETVIPEPFPLSICLFPFGNEYRMTELKINPTQSPELIKWADDRAKKDKEDRVRRIVNDIAVVCKLSADDELREQLGKLIEDITLKLKPK